MYGISSKCYGKVWEHHVKVFYSEAEAQEWLNTEEFDFREREITNSRARAIKIAGKKRVEEAEKWQLN